MHAKSPFFTFATNSLKILAIFYRVHFISAAIFSTDRRSIARTDRRRVGKVIRTKHAAKLSAANFLCICWNSLTFISSLGKRWKSRCKLIIIYHESPAKVETCSNNAAVVVVGWLMRDDWSSDKKKKRKKKGRGSRLLSTDGMKNFVSFLYCLHITRRMFRNVFNVPSIITGVHQPLWNVARLHV